MKKKELDKIAEKLQALELQLWYNWGFKIMNGGFVNIDMYDFDDNYIYVEIKSGIQCGGDGDYVRTENGKLNRETLELI
jgi:hypothetical protein